jgi:hypothetical protein
MFSFSRELVNGRISGLDAFRVQHAIDFKQTLQATDFPIIDAVFNAFKQYVARQPELKMTAAQLDRNRSFIALQLRFNVVTAAYGRVAADRVFITTDDPQVAKAVEVLPRARDLATNAMRTHGQE